MTSQQVWTIGVNTITGACYFSIPLCLYRIAANSTALAANLQLSAADRDYFIWSSQSFVLLGVLFITSCGFTHLLRAVKEYVAWGGDCAWCQQLELFMQTVTAIVSGMTAVFLATQWRAIASVLSRIEVLPQGQATKAAKELAQKNEEESQHHMRAIQVKQAATAMVEGIRRDMDRLRDEKSDVEARLAAAHATLRCAAQQKSCLYWSQRAAARGEVRGASHGGAVLGRAVELRSIPTPLADAAGAGPSAAPRDEFDEV